MAVNNVLAGKSIVQAGDEMNKLALIMNGSVRAVFPGGSITLRKGDIIGIADMGHRHFVMSYETIENTSLVEFPFEVNQLLPFLEKNRDLYSYFVNSLFRQFDSISGQYKLINNEYTCIKDYLISGYEEYQELSEKMAFSSGELAEFEETMNLEYDEFLPDWILGYYGSFELLMAGADNSIKNPEFLTGLILKTGQDFTQVVTSCSEIETTKQDILNLLFNENKIDLFELYQSLYLRAVKKYGIDDDNVGIIYRTMNDIIMQLRTQEMDNTPYFKQRISEFEKSMTLAEELSNNLEESKTVHGEEQIKDITDSIETILNYSGVDEELRISFVKDVTEYKNTVNKNSSEDDVRRLRNRLTKEFNDIYIKTFEVTTREADCPTVIKMFLNFGYVDEELIGIDNAVYLYNIVETLPTSPANGVYSYHQWLMAIYRGDKDPGRNEFDVDFAEYLHEEMRNKRISKEDEQEMFQDPILRVKYELENLFPVVNKVTTGRISTFCPLLSEHNVLKSIDSMLVRADEVKKCINKIRDIDYGAFYRETMFADPDSGIAKEMIDVEVLPDIILVPNIGNRSMMWQEIEGKRRTTPARMFVSILLQEDLMMQIIKLTGQFRWEMCKRVQGARWNDITEHSLTSEYCDYVQYYKKNQDLSTEAKDKIRNDLIRCKNSFREMFVKDYQVWILYESTGSPRMNKVVRAQFFTYIPFSASIRNALKINPMYKESVERYEVKQGAKIHRMDNLIRKVQNMGKEVPEEIQNEMEFLKA